MFIWKQRTFAENKNISWNQTLLKINKKWDKKKKKVFDYVQHVSGQIPNSWIHKVDNNDHIQSL